MKRHNLMVSLMCITCLTACGMELPDASEIEGIMSQYYDDIAAYDYAGMREAYTPDLVILDDGQRLDGAGFEDLVRGLEERALTWDFELSEFDTELTPNLAYTSYAITSPPDRKWFGSAILERSGDEWLIDRLVMMSEAQAAAVQPGGAGEPQLRISQITGDLYRFQNGGHYNVFLVTPDGIIMTDPVSEYTDEAALWLKEQMAQRFDVPVRYVVYSHHHLDHAAGGGVFADTAEFVGHENMLEKFSAPPAEQPLRRFFMGLDQDGDGRLGPAERGPLGERFEDWDADGDGYLTGYEVATRVVDRVRQPDTVYADRMTIELGGKTVELIHTVNHSDDMTVVYFPEERVVFGVDFLSAFSGIPGGGFAGSSMTDWIESYKTVEALDFDILAPGHGPMGRKADVTLTRMAWEDLHEAVAEGIAEGKDVEELQASITLGEYVAYPDYTERLQSGIAEAYRAISMHE